MAKTQVEEEAYKETVHNFGTTFATNSTGFAQLPEENQQRGTNIAVSLHTMYIQIHEMTNMLHNMSLMAPKPYQMPQQEYQPLPQQPFIQPLIQFNHILQQ